ncbi:hypothetical protein INT45_002735 [Circinella minor]|uniref:F-box domain-containing protein n=1 Tax=Circinella minor TaxID=1195481 RepID=A0A8H7S4Q0_9FUNG|nr:hypothetical protein INT45_002735 [Circinella minor]
MADNNTKKNELIQTVDLELYTATIQKFNECATSNKSSYQEIDKAAADALDIVLDSQVLVLLNVRAYSLCMQGHLEKALKSIQKMIEYVPRSPTIYQSKANILSMYGYQARAIEAYNDSLKYAALDHMCVPIKLLKSKNDAVAKNKIRIDIIAIIPYDVTSTIIKMLPPSTRIECLNVSKHWRKIILGSAAIWRNIVVSDGEDDSPLLTSAITQIAPYVEHLTINTSRESTRLLYLQSMKDGLFSKLTTLEMREQALQNIHPYFTVLVTAFWNTAKHTLTTIDLDFGDHRPTVTLIDILSSCNFAALQHQNIALVDLKLKFKSINGNAIDRMLQKCNQLRRLILNKCDISVLPSFIKYGTNIKFLYINPEEYEMPTSVLDNQLNYIIETGKEVLHIDSGTYEAIPSSSVMPILYENQKTLRILHTDMKSIDRDQLQQLYKKYHDFELNALTHLTFYAFEGTTSLILNSIRNATALSYMDIRKIHDFHRVATFLSNRPHGLKELRIKYVDKDANIRIQDLIDLFNRHARLSKKSPELALEQIHLVNVSGINDKALAALANIKTIKGINFCNLPDITENDISTFFKEINRYQLTYIRLAHMDSITNQVIRDLQFLEVLNCLELDSLQVILVQITMSIQSRYSLRKRTINKSNAFITNDNQVQLGIEPTEYHSHSENNNVKEIRVKLEEYEEEEVERLSFVSQESYSERNNMTLQVSQNSISKIVKQEDNLNSVEQRQPMVIPASVDPWPSEAFESGSESENFDIKEEVSSEVEQLISSTDMYFNESSSNDANSNSNGSEFEGNSDSENSFDDDYATSAQTRSHQKNQRRTASRYNNINKGNKIFETDEQSSGDDYMDEDEDDDYDYEDDDDDDDDYAEDDGDDNDDDDDDYAEDDGDDNDNDNEKPLLLTKRKRPQEEDSTPSSSDESEEDTRPATKMGLKKNTLSLRKQPQDRLYCPYRECIRSSLQRSEIYGHIRAKHNPKFPSLANRVNIRVRLGFKTVGGKVIDFSDDY